MNSEICETNINTNGIIREKDAVVSLQNGKSEIPENNKKKFLSFSMREWRFLLAFGMTNIFRASVILINGPFYPPLAISKGVSGSVIGFVFGIYDLGILLISPIYGNYIIPRLGAKNVFVISAIFLGMTSSAFGLLAYIEDITLFIVMCLITRFTAGAMDAGLRPSAMTIFTIESPSHVSTCIAILEIFFGIGAVVSPPASGAIIDYVGFTSIYVILGIMTSICGIITFFVIPKPKETSNFEFIQSDWKKIWHLITIPKAYVIFFHLFVCAISIGFVQGTLEKHLKQFDLTSFHVGLIFTISTFMYTISCPIWGVLIDKDKKDKYQLQIITAGILLICLSYCLLGPLPFLGEKSSLWVILLGFATLGAGVGCSIMSAYPIALKSALERSFSKSIETYSAISSSYAAIFALGCCIGPTLGGVLNDAFGFRYGTGSVVILSLLVSIAQFLTFWP